MEKEDYLIVRQELVGRGKVSTKPGVYTRRPERTAAGESTVGGERREGIKSAGGAQKSPRESAAHPVAHARKDDGVGAAPPSGAAPRSNYSAPAVPLPAARTSPADAQQKRCILRNSPAAQSVLRKALLARAFALCRAAG